MISIIPMATAEGLSSIPTIQSTSSLVRLRASKYHGGYIVEEGPIDDVDGIDVLVDVIFVDVVGIAEMT